MRLAISGHLEPPKKRGEKWWGVDIQALGIHTQGKNKKDCYEMAKDAVETLFDGKDIVLGIEALGETDFLVSVKMTEELLALILRRLRATSGLKIMDIAKKMGSHSPNAYAQYEQGKAMPSMEKLSEILEAINPKYEPVLKIS
jgi:hypothetical protein